MTDLVDSGALLRAHALTKDFPARGPGLRGARDRLRAVDGFELAIASGEALGIVGESGSGKTTVARCLLRLIRPTSGEVLFDGRPLFSLSGADLKAFRRQSQIVFQDPFASLDPRFTVLRTLAEPLRVHGVCSAADIPERVAELLQRVGLSEDFSPRYRHELSGGEAQRVSVARALATGPRFLVLDEPTSALDASARLRVISLLRDLRRELAMTYLVISHDLNTIRNLCDRVLVMYLGRVVESAPTATLFARPRHPYTEALLSATPVMRGGRTTVRVRLREAVDATASASGCSLAPRCTYAVAACATRLQQLTPIAPGHSIACHRVSEGEIELSGATPTTLTTQTEEESR